MDTISFIIPTYNEEKNIIDKLNNTYYIEYPASFMEIIIIDCSDDKTMSLIEDWHQRHDVRLIVHHDDTRIGHDITYATNKGISLATGDIIVRTDADSIIDRNAITHLLKSFSDPKIGLVTGQPVPVGSLVENDYRSINTTIQLIESAIDSTIISHGPFTAFRRSLNIQLNQGFAAEDSGIAVKTRKMGYKAILNPNIIFYEKTSPTGREEQKIRRATGLISLLWKNKDVMFRPKYGYYGFLIYPFNFFTTIVAPIILSPILIPLILLKLRVNTIIETFQFLLKAEHRLLFTKKATMYWEKSL